LAGGKHSAANVVAKAQAILSEPAMLRTMFDVGYLPPNTAAILMSSALLESSNRQKCPRQRHIAASLPKASAYSCVVFGRHRYFGRPTPQCSRPK
jgi:hypothetical protein